MTNVARELPAHLALALTHLTAAAGPLRVFSADQAYAIGLGVQTVQRLVAVGVLTRVERGWYMPSDSALTPRERHLRRTYAIVRGREGRVVASHHSALIVHGLPDFSADLSTVHVTYRVSNTFRRRRGCVSHAVDVSSALAAGARSGVEPDGGAAGSPWPVRPSVLTVDIAFAIVQAGMENGPLAALVAGDAALHRGMTTREAITAAAHAYRHTPGIAQVMAIIEHVDGRAESPPESLVRYGLTQLGWRPVPQFEIRVDGRRFRSDLALVRERALVEIDGAVKYEGPDAKSVVMAEKSRHAALRRADWRVIRLTWGDIVAPTGILRLGNVRDIVERELAGR